MTLLAIPALGLPTPVSALRIDDILEDMGSGLLR